MKSNQTIVGFVFIVLWILLLLAMSDTYIPTNQPAPDSVEPCFINGHPMWYNC